MSKIRKLAGTYADLALLTSRQSEHHLRLHALMLAIAETPFVAWDDTKRCRPGISFQLRSAFPALGFGAKHELVPDHGTTARPRDAGYWYDLAVRQCRDDALIDVLGLLSNFCIALDDAIHCAERDRDDESASGRRDDITLDLRKRYGIRRLCQFCWRPAENGRGATTCHRHSPFKNQAEYKWAKRHGMTTPPELKLVFDRGAIRIMTKDPEYATLLSVIRGMSDDWQAAVQAGVAQEVIEGLDGLTYKPLKPANSYKSWADFHQHLRRAFDVGPLPDDPDYTFAWLPYAMREVKETRAREATRKAEAESWSRDNVLALARDLACKRGWQSEIARRLSISRQRVSQILREQSGI